MAKLKLENAQPVIVALEAGENVTRKEISEAMVMVGLAIAMADSILPEGEADKLDPLVDLYVKSNEIMDDLPALSALLKQIVDVQKGIDFNI